MLDCLLEIFFFLLASTSRALHFEMYGLVKYFLGFTHQ